VLNEPSVVAVDKNTGEVLNNGMAVGIEAKAMLGKTPGNIQAIRPLKNGVIADFDVTEKMLRYFITKVHAGRNWVKPRVVIAVPVGITAVERRAVINSAERAGARKVYLIEEPLAAGLGIDLPVREPFGSLIVDIGGGTADIAVMALGELVVSTSLRIAGDEMDEAIIKYIREKYNVLISESAAEEVKWNLGSAYPSEKPRTMSISGRDQFEGLPKTLVLNDTEIREALSEPISAIIDIVRRALNETPPQLAADLIDRGICLTGGGSKIQGLDIRLAKETHLPCYRAENPETAVVRGTARLLEDIPFLRRIQILD